MARTSNASTPSSSRRRFSSWSDCGCSNSAVTISIRRTVAINPDEQERLSSDLVVQEVGTQGVGEFGDDQDEESSFQYEYTALERAHLPGHGLDDGPECADHY